MTDDVRQVLADDADEAWERVTDDPDVLGVETARFDEAAGWQVTVAVMEFIRDEPLESELRRRIAAALQSVAGVDTAMEEDREVWFVTGMPSGVSLVRAVARIVDEFADQTRAYVTG